MGKPQRWLISPEELNGWLDSLADSRVLIAPREADGVVLYRRVAKSDEIDREARPVLSVKEVFFPPTERLFTIEKTGQEVHLVEALPEAPSIVFGVRPCEARAARLLDALFLDTNPTDAYYTRRRENTTLIGLACAEPGPTCFCTSVGGAPDAADDVDIMLYENGTSYLVEAVTEKGRFLIPGGEWKKTTAKPKSSIDNPLRSAPGTLRSPQSPPRRSGDASQSSIPLASLEGRSAVVNPHSIPWPEHFGDAYWQRISERCLSCRACAYVCPTCRCFAVRDEMLGPGEFERIRCWDSCAGENYRRVAGGHRPRPEKGERLRNRFYCKFFYYPQQVGLDGTSACTGCGRCIDVCPAGVDITEVLQDLGRPA
jgi:sulfhydrogenase subunit beta (sulfur reductase)